MTHIQTVDNNQKSKTFGKPITLPVTVIDAPSLFVCGFRFYKTSSSCSCLLPVGEKWADNLPKNLHMKIGKFSKKPKSDIKDYDNITLIVSTQPEKGSMKKKKPEVFELGIGGENEKKAEYANSILGKEIKANDIFKPGEYVDASGVTKAFGFTGPVKRFGIHVQTRKNEKHHRHVGCTGSETPAKMDWRTPAAGQHGFHNRTEFNKRVLIIDNDPKRVNPKDGFIGYGPLKGTFILVEGSVPGTRKRLIRIRRSVRLKKVVPIEIKHISVASKQGGRQIIRKDEKKVK